MSKGWIKLHRKICESFIWDNKEPFDKRSAWIDLLLMVNHERKEILINNDILVVDAGQRFTSVRKLAERWMWSRSKVNRFLLLLEKAKMVTQDKTHNGTLITVIKWSSYQDVRTTEKATNRTTNEPHASHACSTNKNVRMIKNEEKKEYKASPSFSEDF